MPDTIVTQLVQWIYEDPAKKADAPSGIKIILTEGGHTVIRGEIFKPAGPVDPTKHDPDILLWPPPGYPSASLQLVDAHVVQLKGNEENCLVYRVPRLPHKHEPSQQIESEDLWEKEPAVQEVCGIAATAKRTTVHYGASGVKISGHLAIDHRDWLALLLDPGNPWEGFPFDYTKDPRPPEAYYHLVDVKIKQPKAGTPLGTLGSPYKVLFDDINCCGDRF